MLQKQKAAEQASQAGQSQGSEQAAEGEPVVGTSDEPEISFTFASPAAVDLEKGHGGR